MKTAVVSSAPGYSSLTSVSQSSYVGQQHSSSAMYGSSLHQQQQQQPVAGGSVGGGTGAVGGGRTNHYQYYSASQSQPAPASQQYTHYYAGSQVDISSSCAVQFKNRLIRAVNNASSEYENSCKKRFLNSLVYCILMMR